MIKVCLVGLGKSGREVAGVLLEQEGVRLVSVVCSPGSDKAGKDLGQVINRCDTGIMVEGADRLEEVIFRTKPDVVVDFSKPEATVRNARIFSRMRINIVVATTGFSKFALKRLSALVRKYRNGIVYAPNITLGVNVLMLLTGIASSILSNYDFQVIEQHHNRKKDIPSGTAIKIAGEIKKGLSSAVTNTEEKAVPIIAVRAGGIIGKHDVLIVGEDDKIEISHESFSRKAFAAGAIRAVKFVYKKSGYFEMADVLDLNSVIGDYLENCKSRIRKRHSYYRDKIDISADEMVN